MRASRTIHSTSAANGASLSAENGRGWRRDRDADQGCGHSSDRDLAPPVTFLADALGRKLERQFASYRLERDLDKVQEKIVIDFRRGLMREDQLVG